MDEQARSVRGYRAKQLREEAAGLRDPEPRQALLEIAAHYERLASRVEQNRIPPETKSITEARMDDEKPSVEGYRKRAEDLRAKAATVSEPNVRKMLLEVAATYDQLAKSLEILGRSTD